MSIKCSFICCSNRNSFKKVKSHGLDGAQRKLRKVCKNEHKWDQGKNGQTTQLVHGLVLTSWDGDAEGFRLRTWSPPVCCTNFENITLPGLQTIYYGWCCSSRVGDGLCSKWLESRGVWKNVFWNDLADGWKEETENSPVSSGQTVWVGWIRTCITKINTLAMHAESTAGV